MKDFHIHEKVMTKEGPGKIVRFGKCKGKVDRAEVQLTYRQTICKWFGLHEIKELRNSG